MTAPRVAPQPLTPPYELHAPTWCRECQIHRATVGRPICPVCLDDRKREALHDEPGTCGCGVAGCVWGHGA